MVLKIKTTVMREKIYGIEVESYGLTEDIYGQK